jgi:diguanylate cyclase (GGDEF)-like protein
MRIKNYHTQLQMQALYDLTMRAKAGMVMYLAIWIAIVWAYNIHEKSPTFFYANGGILLSLAVVRLIHLFKTKQCTEDNAEHLYQILVYILLCTALHWGLMTAWVLLDDNFIEARTVIMIVLPTFAIGGASTLSISHEVRTLYPTFMFMPTICALLYTIDRDNFLLAGLIIVAFAYVFVISGLVYRNYWSAITNNLIAEERAAAMEQLSITDQLTQLKNRMFFDSEFEKEWKRSIRLKAPLSILMIDLDYFKKLNDTFGHIFGDEVLKHASAAIANEIKRPTDCVARYGGEEFVAMLPNTNLDGAKVIAERIRKTIESLPLEHNSRPVSLTCSIGGATIIPQPGGDRSDLVKRADSALYQAKDGGRNRYLADDPRANLEQVS